MNTKVSVKEKICYGIGSGGGNIITQILGTFLTAYYTDSVGIAAAAVGTMMLVARLLDGISDVMMGGIVDKTRTKWGKARPWILISAPVICIGLILTFNVPESLSSSAKLIYAYITYVFLNCIAFTAYYRKLDHRSRRICGNCKSTDSICQLSHHLCICMVWSNPCSTASGSQPAPEHR